MSDTAYLALENGRVFAGQSFGAAGEAAGEVVFTTGMTGYPETLTDPNYHGQIVLHTFPLIGNYGVIPSDFESDRVRPAGYIVKVPCQSPSNFRSEGPLDTFLQQKGVPGLCGVDTRALTRVIRENGVMNGRILMRPPAQADFEALRAYRIQNAVEAVSSARPECREAEGARFTVALLDFGCRESIRRALLERGCTVWTLPWNSTARDVAALGPDGIVLSNGPGDPTGDTGLIDRLKEILALKLPLFGIGLGHQLLALANGFETRKLKYGHRGLNQPARDTQTGRVHITAQNHGFVVASDSIDQRVAGVWFVNVNDGTCEGLLYQRAPAFSVQFHPEDGFLFDRLIERMEGKQNAAG